MTPSEIKKNLAPEIRAAIERMEQNTTWGKFMWWAKPWHTVYYAFQHRYVSERYLLRQHEIQLQVDAA